MTEETKQTKRRAKLRGSWMDCLVGNHKEEDNTPETMAIDFIKNKSYSVQYKLQILATCIDILNEEVGDKP